MKLRELYLKEAPNRSYKIVRGDTLTKIAKQHGTTIQDIMKLNPSIKDPNKIFADQTIVIPPDPKAAAAAPAQTPGKDAQAAADDFAGGNAQGGEFDTTAKTKSATGSVDPVGTGSVDDPAKTATPKPKPAPKPQAGPNVQQKIDRFNELLNKAQGIQMTSTNFSDIAITEALNAQEMKELQTLYKELQGFVGTDPNLDKSIETALNKYLQVQKQGYLKAPADTTAADNQAKADDAQKAGDASYANDPQATDDTRDGDDLGNAPTAPKVADEKYMQMNDTGRAGLANFNVQKMKAKYPEPYLDIPDKNNPGYVIRAYGPEANLTAFMKQDPRGKNAKLSGSATTTAPVDSTDAELDKSTQTTDKLKSQGSVVGTPSDAEKQKQASDDAADAASDKRQDDFQKDKEAASDKMKGQQSTDIDTTAGADADTGAEKTYDVNGKKMTRNEVSKRINELLRKSKQSVQTAGMNFGSILGKMLSEQLSSAELKELQGLIDAVKGDRYFATLMNSKRIKTALINAGVTGLPDKPAKDPNRGKTNDKTTTTTSSNNKGTTSSDGGTGSSYTVNGKPASREEYEKVFGKDTSGRHNDYQRIRNQIESLGTKARDEKLKWEQAQLSDPDSPYYRGVPADPDDPSYPKELRAIDDKYKKQGQELEQKAKDLASDPDVKKLIDQGGDKFDQELMKSDDAFDRMLDGDDDFDGSFNKMKSKIDKMKNKKSKTSSSSSSSSSVTTTSSSSTTTRTSGGGSTTRFARLMRDTDETKALKAEKKALRKKMRDWGDEWGKQNPEADTFDYTEQPEYKEMEAEYDSYEGMDGKIAKSQEMVHPSGEMDSDGNIKYNTKDGKWDGEQFDPDRKTKKKKKADEAITPASDFDEMMQLAGLTWT